MVNGYEGPRDFGTQVAGTVALGLVGLLCLILVGCAFSVRFDPQSGKVSSVEVTPVPELMLSMGTAALTSWLDRERAELESLTEQAGSADAAAVEIHQTLIDGIINVLTERGVDAFGKAEK